MKNDMLRVCATKFHLITRILTILVFHNIKHEFQRFLMYEITCLGHDLIWSQKTVVVAVKCLDSMFEFIKLLVLFIFAENFIFTYDTP